MTDGVIPLEICICITGYPLAFAAEFNVEHYVFSGMEIEDGISFSPHHLLPFP